MFKNYIKTALRNLLRSKLYSIINIIGLSIGIICAILIVLYVQNELSYDKHHKNHKRIYRLESDYFISGKQDLFALTSIPLAPTLKFEYPEIEHFVRFMNAEEVLLTYGEKKFYETGVFLSDSTVFKVFTHPFVYGSPDNALTQPNSIVLTKSMSQKYFGDENSIGNVIRTGDGTDLKVTGVIEDPPNNLHLKFNALISMMTIVERFGGAERFNDNSSARFWNVNSYSYVLLNENASVDNILSKSDQFYEKYMAELGNQINAGFHLMATNLTKIHHYSKLQWELPTDSISYIYIFSAVAIFLLIIACINYMNMATAQSSKRSKEVGMRKTIGANRKALVFQFLSESLVLAFFALIIALIVIPLVLPVFNHLTGKDLSFGIFSNPFIALIVLGIATLTGLVAGSYPAFYLSSFQAAAILKGELTKGRKSGFLRKVLVVFQFIISVVMIIGTFVVGRQLNYLRDKDLGFDKGNILIVQAQDTSFIRHQMEPFIQEIKRNPNVLAAATSTRIPGQEQGKVVFRVESEGQMTENALSFVFVDHDYIDLMKINIKDGRQYQREMSTDATESFIINEAAAKQLNWGNEALGKRMQFGIELDGTAQRDGKVIGVVKNFHFNSLHNTVEPFSILLSQDRLNVLSIKISSANTGKTIEFIRQQWESFGNKMPFYYTFLEDRLNKMYDGDRKLGTSFGYFSVIAILIACLGLLGLSSFVAEQRTKEVGIRKVIGATEFNIVWLIARSFLLLVIIANAIAQPLAVIALRKWLQSFAYQTDLGVFTFIISFIISLLVAVSTVSIQAFKAAATDPVKSLRYE